VPSIFDEYSIAGTATINGSTSLATGVAISFTAASAASTVSVAVTACASHTLVTATLTGAPPGASMTVV
jgi:hypothetical protein